MTRVSSQKARQALLVVGDVLNPDYTPEALELYDQFGNPINFGGSNIPPGGTEDQVLAKQSATDFDIGWVDQSGGGSGSADILDETFDTDLSAYVPNASQGGVMSSLSGLVVSGGMLHQTDANSHTFHNPDVEYTDGVQVIKVWPNSLMLIGIMKYITDDRWILMQWLINSLNLQIYQSTESATNVAVGSAMSYPSVSNAPIYLSLALDGQNITASTHVVDPRSGASPYSFAHSRLPDDVASRLVVPGNPGIRMAGFAGGLTNPGVDARLDEWRTYTYR